MGVSLAIRGIRSLFKMTGPDALSQGAMTFPCSLSPLSFRTRLLPSSDVLNVTSPDRCRRNNNGVYNLTPSALVGPDTECRYQVTRIIHIRTRKGHKFRVQELVKKASGIPPLHDLSTPTNRVDRLLRDLRHVFYFVKTPK